MFTSGKNHHFPSLSSKRLNGKPEPSQPHEWVLKKKNKLNKTNFDLGIGGVIIRCFARMSDWNRACEAGGCLPLIKTAALNQSHHRCCKSSQEKERMCDIGKAADYHRITS